MSVSDPAPGAPAVGEYRITLDIDPKEGSWTGTVELDIARGPFRIDLDADGLEIREVQQGGQAAPFRSLPQEQRVEVDLDPSESAPLRVRFAGRIPERALTGFYRCPQGDGVLWTSQCEPIGARRIFPCVDRPDRKARLRLTVRTDPDLEVIANTDAESVRAVDGRREWVFAPTPPMATYLFYLGVGHFDRAEAAPRGTRVRALTAPGRGPSGRFAAESAAEILAAYAEYYGIPYPLPKLDLIAVAEEAFGAMENWGAITFLTTRLLVDESSSSFARRDVFETIAHEVAHQWFGNLVTMRGWTDVWLNESFATFLELKMTERLRPEYAPIEEFILHPWGVIGARHGDSLRATHPVRSPVERPEEISQVFDGISYGKGSSVLRMLEAYLGAERFRAGVTDYLNRFRYGNAETEDLWAALERHSGEPVSRLMHPWIDRPGLPVVSARLEGDRLRLAQDRFSFYGPSPREDPWPIPLWVDVDGHRTPILFDTRERTVPVPASATVLLNPEALGFYRVRYDPGLLDRLLKVLPARPATDRWAVLNDLTAFLVSGDIDWTTYVRVVETLGKTTDRLVVEEIVRPLRDWAIAFPSVAPLQELARRFLADRLDAIGIGRRPDEPPDTGILRETLLAARARVDAGFAQALAEKFLEWPHLDADLRDAVAIARVRTDGPTAFHEMLRALERAPTENERLRFERALAWAPEAGLLRETLELVRNGTIRTWNTRNVLIQLAKNPVGRPLVLPWLEENLPALDASYRGSGELTTLFENVIPWAALGRRAEAQAFFAAHPYPEGSIGLAKGLESLELLERLRTRLPG